MLQGDAVVQGTGAEILAAQVSCDPVELSQAVQQSPLYPVIRRATQKDLALRYTRAFDMLSDLTEPAPVDVTVDAPQLVRSDPPPPPSRGRRTSASVAPVAYGTGESTPPPPPTTTPKRLRLLAAAVSAAMVG